MAQHDMNIANQGFPAFRADLNSALTAIANNSSGATEPSTTFAYQWWYDTSTNALKMRNADNDAWIEIGTFNQTTDSFTPSGVTTDSISEGNSSVAVVDSGTGYVQIVVDGTEAARIDSSGNVGIGSSSPSAKLQVAGDLRLDHNNPIEWGGTAYSIVGNATTGYLQFNTASSERMRIDSSGNLLVGTTAADGVNGLSIKKASNNVNLVFNTSSTSNFLQYFRYYGTNVGTISTTGSSTSYNTSSDYRLKEDWIPVANASDRVAQLKPVNFAWKASGERVDGFLAHELAEVIPEAVTGEKDAMRTEEYEVSPAVYEDVVIPAEYDAEGNLIAEERTEQQLVTEAVMGTREVPDYQGVDQSKIVPLLTAALQEAIAKIEALEARVDALENA